MIEEVIENIIQAETSAENIVKDSQVRAKEMVAKAKELSIAMLDDEKKRVRSEIETACNKATAESEEVARKAIEDCQKEADKLEKASQKNIDKATDYIIRSMTAKYDS